MFVIISLAVQFLVNGIIYNWSSTNSDIGTWCNLTNGPFGISGITKPAIFGIKIDTIGSFLALSSVIMIACAHVFYRLTRSSWGRLLKCLRDDELSLRGLGKGIRMAKVQVFVISCAMAALSGAIFSSYVTYVDPTSASLDESILLLSMLCVGGLGNFRGPIVGAIILTVIPELFRLTPFPGVYAPNIRLMAYGLLLILIVHFRPQGVAGEYRLK
jgi:branched-chain amino acid transport system permease protein